MHAEMQVSKYALSGTIRALETTVFDYRTAATVTNATMRHLISDSQETLARSRSLLSKHRFQP